MKRAERAFSQMPRPLMLGFFLLFGWQAFAHLSATQQSSATYKPLTAPLSADIYWGLSMGSEQLFGYMLAIRLQPDVEERLARLVSNLEEASFHNSLVDTDDALVLYNLACFYFKGNIINGSSILKLFY